MSEATLWDNLRNNLGHRGHFVRLEFNPEAGIPDVEYCIKGIEGKLELKYRDEIPARENTPVFHDGGLRDSQIVWLWRRVVKHGGRADILAQVQRKLFLIDGAECRSFNDLTMMQLAKAALWSHVGEGGKIHWEGLYQAIIRDRSPGITERTARPERQAGQR